jgi:predicted membrane channel-forming protein YqfA (hemolysin III family)
MRLKTGLGPAFPASAPASKTAASQPKPPFRRRLHQGTLFVVIPAGVALVAAARPGANRVAAAVYAISLVGLFASSSAYHRLRWSRRALRRMRSLDHAMISFSSRVRTQPAGYSR